jgi:transcriptional regulator with XRE-family HTH domain
VYQFGACRSNEERMRDQDLNLAIGRRLRAVRTARGLKQADLAAHIGVAFQQIQKYENGTNRLSVAVMLRLCAFMEIDAGEFVNGIDEAAAVQARDEAGSLSEDIRRISDDAVRDNLSALVRSLAALTSANR